jgi:hypothetical protein
MKKINLATKVILFLLIISMPKAFSQVNAGDIIVTEFLANPAAVADADGEWIELYNTTANPIDINSFYLSDGNADTVQLVSATPLIIAAGGYFIIARNSDMSLNGGVAVDYVITGFSVNNSNSAIELTDSSFNVIDMITYTSTISGSSKNLDPAFYNSSDNDNLSNWCNATSIFGAGDFGTPGAVNTTCVVGVNELFQSFVPVIYSADKKLLTVKVNSSAQLIIFNTNGKAVRRFNTSVSAKFEVDDLEEGLYIYQLISTDKTIAGKFVKY